MQSWATRTYQFHTTVDCGRHVKGHTWWTRKISSADISDHTNNSLYSNNILEESGRSYIDTKNSLYSKLRPGRIWYSSDSNKRMPYHTLYGFSIINPIPLLTQKGVISRDRPWWLKNLNGIGFIQLKNVLDYFFSVNY